MTNRESLLINDFPCMELNRRYIVIDGWKLVDITYSKPDSAPPKSEYTGLAPNIREALIKTF